MALNTYLSIITLNVNGLIATAKRHRVAERIRKQEPYIHCLQDTHLRFKDTHRLKIEGDGKDISCKWKEKRAGVAIFISDKIGIKSKAIVRD